FRYPWMRIPTVAEGGRSSGTGQLSLGGGRLKNQVGNSENSVYDRVMIAEHAGSWARQSARRSHAWGVRPASLANGRDGSNVTHQPSCTKSRVEQIFQATSTRMQACARVVRRNRG